MVQIKKIVEFLDKKYPSRLRAKWDFTDGFLEGNQDLDVNEISVAVELNEKIMNSNNKFLILHHPPKFGSEKLVTNPFYSHLKNNPSIYVLHSRIDVSGDINKAIAEFCFEDFIIDNILDDGTTIITLKNEIDLSSIIEVLKIKLNKKCLKVIEKKKKIKKIAIHGGEGFNKHHVDKASQENIDLYLAGDLTHHLAESAFFNDVSFIDIEHISEQIGMNKLTEYLNIEFKDCNFRFIQSDSFWSLK